MILKFRAWDTFDKEMLDVHGINYDVDGVWTKEMIDDESDGEFIHFSDIELLQSTGLFDKNGTEIYEGDILKVFVLGDEWAIAKVIFKNGMFGIEDDMHGYGYDKGLYSLHQILSLRDAEILGNIYEDEHLLGEE